MSRVFVAPRTVPISIRCAARKRHQRAAGSSLLRHIERWVVRSPLRRRPARNAPCSRRSGPIADEIVMRKPDW